ncbi:HvfA family oxazolone/thioamide-modified RiPP metallophore [Psychrobacter lutiphocae]|uniref:HvfA family oxazolone/thioamide-modified RiPP metallophore n=1 Tax=Psychrobacter lutiphocae TaxID=540500 RepID=UPI0003763555|nr:hypothetical protein [Psychrobacter lutiphocae]
MKKSAFITSLALGSLMTMSGANAANPFNAKPMPNAHQSESKAADAKCGEGKCGTTVKKPTKKADAKCGEGKCGGSK